MKLLFMLSLLILSSSPFADYIDPNSTIIEAIRAAQSNNLEKFINIVDIAKVASQKKHAYSANEIIELFKKIKIEEIKFKHTDPSKTPHMLSPYNLQFQIESNQRKEIWPSIIYRIVGIHP